MEKMLTILNFDGCYQMQDFYAQDEVKWIDFEDLSGVRGYCEEEAAEKIREKIRNEKIEVCYIGSGNYHYMTLFLLEKIQEPFSLILFDHHTDMKLSLFEDLLSCGCWVKWALETISFLKEVIIIGAADSFLDTIEAEYQNRVFTWEESKLKQENWQEEMVKQIHYPIYLSIDKDVFDIEEVSTDWDQGTLKLEGMERAYHLLKEVQPIIGADICGEYEKGAASEEIEKNNRANKRIWNML